MERASTHNPHPLAPSPGLWLPPLGIGPAPGEGEDFKDGRGRLCRPLPSLYLFAPSLLRYEAHQGPSNAERGAGG